MRKPNLLAFLAAAFALLPACGTQDLVTRQPSADNKKTSGADAVPQGGSGDGTDPNAGGDGAGSPGAASDGVVGAPKADEPVVAPIDPVVAPPAPKNDAPPVDPNDPRYSHGTGGGAGLVEAPFTAGNGLSSTYKINVPADAGPEKAYGLHIHLHGDGGGGYTDFPNKEARAGLIGVTVKAPNASLTWGRAAGKTHGEFLQELIQTELVKKYNVDLKRIYFSGVSGGSFFLAGNFIPTYGKDYRTAAFLMCGGEAPRVAFVEPDFLKEFKVYWQATAGDRNDILSSVRQSIAAYKKALAGVAGDAAMQQSEIAGAGGHCEFDGKSYTTGIQYMMDLKFAEAVKKAAAAPAP